MAYRPEPWVPLQGVTGRTRYSARALAPLAWHLLCAATALALAVAVGRSATWLIPFPVAAAGAIWVSFAVRRVAVTEEYLVVHHGWFGVGLALGRVREVCVVERRSSRRLGVLWQSRDGEVPVWDLGGDRRRAVRLVYEHEGERRTLLLHVPGAAELVATLAADRARRAASPRASTP